MPEPEPKPEPNADFNATLTFSDGTTKSYHVIRVEASTDSYGMKDWLDSESRLTIFAESGSTAKDLAWNEIKSISIAPKSSDINCVYESDWSPWLYVCTKKTTTSLIDAEGKKWSANATNKWRFYFDDDTDTEFLIQTSVLCNKTPLKYSWVWMPTKILNCTRSYAMRCRNRLCEIDHHRLIATSLFLCCLQFYL